MATQTPRHSFFEPATGEQDWNEAGEFTDNFDKWDNRIPLEEATGTFTATGGASPAADFTASAVSTDETVQILNVQVSPNSAGQVSGNDYAYNVDWRRFYDDANGEVDVSITVNWDTDPGAANDITMEYSILTVNL